MKWFKFERIKILTKSIFGFNGHNKGQKEFNLSKKYPARFIVDRVLGLMEEHKIASKKNDDIEGEVLSIGLILHRNRNIELNKLFDDPDKLKSIHSATGEKFHLFMCMPSTQKDEMFEIKSQNFGELTILPRAEEGLDKLTHEFILHLFDNYIIKLPTLVFLNFSNNEEAIYFSVDLSGFNEERIFKVLQELCLDVEKRLSLIKSEFKENKNEIHRELKEGSKIVIRRYRTLSVIDKFLFIKKIFK